MKKIKCHCSGFFEEKTVEFEGFDVKGMKCNKCGEITFLPEQFKAVLALKELAKGIDSERKIIKIGNSLGFTLPKAVEGLGLKIGQKIQVKLEDRKKLGVVLS